MIAGQPLGTGTPPAEVEISSSLVATLLSEQHPDLAHLPMRMVGEGWDNAMFRLDDHLAVRLPRRAAAANLILHEQTWLPRLARGLSLPVPSPYRVGIPNGTYPWQWSVVPWLAGDPADQHELTSSQAKVLGGFLRSLHVPAPSDAPVNPFRGVPLQQRALTMKERITRLAAKTDLITPAINRIWEAGVTTTIDVPSTWLHGDLHPRNVLVNDRFISGIIDWGDITCGDPATDLASIWMLFAEAPAHDIALKAYGEVSEASIRRAKAWSLFFAVMLLDTGLTDNQRNAALGKKIFKNLAAR
jgi:aminoglycoside phosphotransferase (APT) family kinase protein